MILDDMQLCQSIKCVVVRISIYLTLLKLSKISKNIWHTHSILKINLFLLYPLSYWLTARKTSLPPSDTPISSSPQFSSICRSSQQRFIWWPRRLTLSGYGYPLCDSYSPSFRIHGDIRDHVTIDLFQLSRHATYISEST